MKNVVVAGGGVLGSQIAFQAAYKNLKLESNSAKVVEDVVIVIEFVAEKGETNERFCNRLTWLPAGENSDGD